MTQHEWQIRGRLIRLAPAISLLLALCAGVAGLQAQEPDPLAAPGGGAPAAAPTDPAVLAVLETNPTTPSERVTAILLLIRLDEAAAAKPLVSALLEANLDDAAWSDVVHDFGAAAFVKIGLDEALQPEGKQLSDTALTAANRVAHDPARLAELVRELSAPSAGQRQSAVMQLRRAGPAAVAPLVAALADAARQQEHAVVRSMLIALGAVGHEALIPALESGLPALQAQVAEVLGRTNASEALPWLLNAALADPLDPQYRDAARNAIGLLTGRVPGKKAAAEYLYRRGLDSYEGRAPLDIDADGQALLWQWDAEAGASVQKPTPVAIARRRIAAELAERALELDPGLQPARNLSRIAALEIEAYRAGLDNPLPAGPGSVRDQLAQLDPQELSALLDDCLKHRRTVAAAAVAEILGSAGHSSLLHSAGVWPTPLVRAAADDDRRVRFAALGAIVKLKPTRPFSGSSAVPRGLEYFFSSLGGRGAVVAAPQVEEAARLAGLLAQAGFEPQIATEPRGVFQLASQMSDCELVVIHVLIGAPGAADTIDELRRDPRTAELPVVIVGPPRYEERAHDIARRDPLTAAWIRPMNLDGVTVQLQELNAQALAMGVEAGSPELRLKQAGEALGWLDQLLDLRPQLYDLRELVDGVENALHVPGLTSQAAVVLGKLPSPRAQLALVELASLENSRVAERAEAAEAFAHSVARYGSLLTTEEMQRQFDRYNASEFKDEAEQRLLASLLDALEAGRAPVVEPGRR